MRIRILSDVAGLGYSFQRGAEVDLAEDLALAWCINGTAEAVPASGDGPATREAAVRETPETAVQPRARGRK